jgi:hypothetical protein
MKFKIIPLLINVLFLVSSFKIHEKASQITVYEGSCQVYTETLTSSNQRQEAFDRTGVGQVVINESTHTFSFYLDDRVLIKAQPYTTSYTEDRESIYYNTKSEYSVVYVPRKKGFHIIITPNDFHVIKWKEYYLANCSTRH